MKQRSVVKQNLLSIETIEDTDTAATTVPEEPFSGKNRRPCDNVMIRDRRVSMIALVFSLISLFVNWQQDYGDVAAELEEVVPSVRNRTDVEPEFVMHIGLPKAGSTSIQGALGLSLYHQLKDNDNYYFLGKTRGIRKNELMYHQYMSKDAFMQFAMTQDRCLFPKQKGRRFRNEVCTLDSKPVREFIALLGRHYVRGHHLSVSEEGISMLSTKRIQLIHDIIQKAGFRKVKVIIVSRLYHEWVVSWIQQYFRAATWNRQHYQSFPGAVVPTLTEFLNDPAFYTQQCHFDGCDWYLEADRHPSLSLKEKFSRVFHESQIHLMDFAQPGDLVTNFICDGLSHAKETCRAVKNGTIPSPKLLNPAISHYIMDYELLTQEIGKILGSPSEKMIRRKIFQKVANHHSKQSHCPQEDFKAGECELLRFPKRCLTTSQREALADKSVGYEKKIFPRKSVDQLRRNTLNKIINSEDKYCFVDIDKTLNKPEWKELLHKMKQRLD